MTTSVCRIASNSWIASPDGPCLVRELTDASRVFVVRPDGTLKVTNLVGSPPIARCQPSVSLLTAIGDLTAARSSRWVSRSGTLEVRQIASMSRSGNPARLEVLASSYIESVAKVAERRRRSYRLALASLPERRVILPRYLVEDFGLNDRLEALFKEAAVKYTQYMHPRWVSYSFSLPSIPAPGADEIDNDALANALLILRAWAYEDQALVARTLVGEFLYRNRLLAALAAANRPFHVKWIPTYMPVEAHIYLVPRPGSQSYVAVVRAIESIVDISDLTFDGRGSLVINLALAASARLTI